MLCYAQIFKFNLIISYHTLYKNTVQIFDYQYDIDLPKIYL